MSESSIEYGTIGGSKTNSSQQSLCIESNRIKSIFKLIAAPSCRKKEGEKNPVRSVLFPH